VILIYPLLLIVAAVIIWRTRARRGAGWSGFMAWYVAGALFTFSLLTGFSIGLFLLPLVVLAIYSAIRLAPGFRAALGFIGGSGRSSWSLHRSTTPLWTGSSRASPSAVSLWRRS
jgi:hypothetical protein